MKPMLLAMAILAVGSASEIDCDTGALLSRPATAVLRTERNEPKPWMKRWTEAYLELEPFQISRDLVSEFVKSAIGGLVGELIGALIRWFWPRKGPSKEECLMNIIMQWTQDYVGMEIAQTIKSLAFSDLETAKKQVLVYQEFREVLEKEASKPWKRWHPKPEFPVEQWLETRIKLENALMLCDLAMDKISPTSQQKNQTKAVAIPAFLTAATLKMTLLRETYNLTVFRETWTPRQQRAPKAASQGELSYVPSQKIIDNMKSALEGLTKQAGDLKQIWLNWRKGKLECKSYHFKDWSGKHYEMRLTDKLIDWFWMYDGEGTDWSWFDEWESQYCKTITRQYMETLFIKELVPMFTPFTALQRLIPGYEKKGKARGPLPEKVLLTTSSWLARSYHLLRKDEKRTDATEKVEYKGPITKIDGRTGQIIDQLIFETNGATVLRLPEESTGGLPASSVALPSRTCGFDLTYLDRNMARLVAFNQLNETAVFGGWYPEELGGPFNIGPALCGLYTFDTISKIVKHREATGDPIQLEFKWDPHDP